MQTHAIYVLVYIMQYQTVYSIQSVICANGQNGTMHKHIYGQHVSIQIVAF